MEGEEAQKKLHYKLEGIKGAIEGMDEALDALEGGLLPPGARDAHTCICTRTHPNVHHAYAQLPVSALPRVSRRMICTPSGTVPHGTDLRASYVSTHLARTHGRVQQHAPLPGAQYQRDRPLLDVACMGLFARGVCRRVSDRPGRR